MTMSQTPIPMLKIINHGLKYNQIRIIGMLYLCKILKAPFKSLFCTKTVFPKNMAFLCWDIVLLDYVPCMNRSQECFKFMWLILKIKNSSNVDVKFRAKSKAELVEENIILDFIQQAISIPTNIYCRLIEAKRIIC